jgi:6-phosphofructokinase 1
MTPLDLHIQQLGPARRESPLNAQANRAGAPRAFTSDDLRLPMHVQGGAPAAGDASFELAGPRRQIYFDPAQTTAAVVTCGGLCPGLNDVIRALVMELHYGYGVRKIYGIRYGYAGLVPGTPEPPCLLTLEAIDDIHQHGGTILGTSRGNQDPKRMVDMLVELGINLLFTIGGDGTFRGAHAVAEEVERRGLPIGLVAIPKTIDNDIDLIYRCFGFKTAVEEANRVLDCAHVEAKGARGGIGLVKLMGRESGFIAAHATLANCDVNYCLIPEVPFALHGEGGLLNHLRRRLSERKHAVIVAAEGAGQHLLGESTEKDASGNTRLKDIGLFLKEEIQAAFAGWGEPVAIRYFDPSYIIRSVPANSDDSIFCADLARGAVHAAMAGKTDLFIGYWHGVFTHVPLAAVAGRRRKIDPQSSLWHAVLSTTGQPAVFG